MDLKNDRWKYVLGTIVFLLLPILLSNPVSEYLPVFSPVSNNVIEKEIQPIRLISNGMPISQLSRIGSKPTGLIHKLTYQAKNANYRYIVFRAKSNLKSFFATKWHFLILFSLSVVSVCIVKRKFVQFKFRKAFNLVVLLIGLGSLLLAFQKKSESSILHVQKKVSFDIRKESVSGVVPIFNRYHQIIGNVVWGLRDSIKLDYFFGPGEVESKIQEIRQNHKVLAFSSATYIDSNVQPVGYCSFYGSLLNNNLEPAWDGLVILRHGKIMLVNLETTQIIGAKKDSLFHVIELAQKEISAFQLPLMVFDNKRMFKTHNLPAKIRETRILGQVVDDGGNVYCILADFKHPDFPAASVNSLIDFLWSNNYSIDFLVSLDVGGNNFFQAFSDDEQNSLKTSGTIPAKHASNILILMREKQ